LAQALLRQALLFFVPLLLLAVFFHVQYGRLATESQRRHLTSVAEHQARMLELFIEERWINLAALAEQQGSPLLDPSPDRLEAALASLERRSRAFVDLAVVGADGRLRAYAGPERWDDTVCYAGEEWLKRLLGGDADQVVTDIYLGRRGKPHFTLGVRRRVDGEARVLRSVLSPDGIQHHLSTLAGATSVHTALVNREGVFQVVGPEEGRPLEPSPYKPPAAPERGSLTDPAAGTTYAYAWLRETPWAVVVRDAATESGGRGLLLGMQDTLLAATAAFFVLLAVAIVVRARQSAVHEVAMERHEAELSGQLVQAAKLASVGELAGGIAHEINNPLAIITEEVGLIGDLLDPELGKGEDFDWKPHLETIHDAAFRCRDITRKLLSFVRQTDVRIERHDLHAVLDEVLEGMLGTEMELSNIDIVREYCPRARPVFTDRNQLVQVFLNLTKNAVDAIGETGTLTVRTVCLEDGLAVTVQDTGCGMTPEQLERVFQPFYTTKEPGKGTGLGLSVSLGIVQSLGGRIWVESTPGKGSTFTVELPYELEGEAHG